MATTQNRTTEDVRREIEHEREQLVLAVDQLRSEATSFKRKLPKIAAGVVAAVVAYRVGKYLLTRNR
jgi:hypothetical protein